MPPRNSPAISYKVLLQASGTGLLNEQRALAQQQNNGDRRFFSRLLSCSLSRVSACFAYRQQSGENVP